MKNFIITLILLVGFMTTAEAKSSNTETGYGSFYSYLAPHGVWMEFDDGLVVWRPTIMRRGWAPYSIGRWIWTEFGWYWDSYESFGFITYHYGRWFYDDYYGWVWVPDYDWAPAWVEWRYDDSYIGWAPLPPYAVFSVNIGIHFTFNYVTPYSHWHFVNYNYICDPHVYKHYVGPKYKYRVFSNTKYRNDYGYSNGRIINRGVDISDVRSRSGQDIRQRTIQQVTDPGELTKHDNSRNNYVVRTFVASREDLKKVNIRDTDVRKIERRSPLEKSKLQLGDTKESRADFDFRKRNDDSKNIVRDRNIKNNNAEEKGTVENENRIPYGVKRDNANEIERKRNEERINVERKHENKTILNGHQKKESSTFKNRNNTNNSRTGTNKLDRRGNIQLERKQTETKVERKIESKIQNTRNVSRNDEQKRNSSGNAEKRVNQERSTSDKIRAR